MLDVAGQDATEAFEDVGHSDEARETLDQLYAGVLKRQVSLDDRQHPPNTQLGDGEDLQSHPSVVRSSADDQLSLQPGDPTPKAPKPGAVTPASTGDATGLGIGVYAIVLIGGAAAYFAYQYLQAQQQQQAGQAA